MNKRSFAALAAAVTFCLASAANAQSTSTDTKSDPEKPRSTQSDSMSADTRSSTSSMPSKTPSQAAASGKMADQDGAMAAKPFEKMDANGDRYIGKTELAQDSRLADVFTTYDSNRDGRLSRDEYANWTALEGGVAAAESSKAAQAGGRATSSSGSSAAAGTAGAAAVGSSDRATTDSVAGTGTGTSQTRSTGMDDRKDTWQGAELAFDELDVDGDGYLRKVDTDRKPSLAGHFDALDRNGDDRVSRSEYSAWQATLSGDQQRALTQEDEQDIPEVQRQEDQ